MVQTVKKLPANAKDLGLNPGSEYPLKKGMTIHSNTLCLKNSMDRGDWQSMRLQRVGH